MSITNGAPEPAENNDPQRPPGLFESVATYIRNLKFPNREILSDHAAHNSHEDVPDDAVKSADHLPNQQRLCPDRLRPLLPPANFGAVVPNSVYRSSYPAAENYEFLKSLKLKTILTLVPEELSFDYLSFMAEAGIQHHQVHIPANKGEVKIHKCQILQALNIVLDRTNHPILIHCNKGKHRTGCVVGCFRRIQGEELNSVFEEYHAYADPKARIMDEAFIKQFDDDTASWMARRYGHIATRMPVPPPSPESSVTSYETWSVARSPA
ncbi:hypothetical protein EJ04DRAFT_530984 [Polyplosphaeria fusca]|uniref:diphosphoinositol-polyphosphate diphosphatase n=1 Tax=Polyplosphaeria fusca TaxID=682080 RepID=A0A9P4RC55_9PLEO|nr:hypothetical protein EJ04DRAFT_530984 [Polyplosphaeria fusca]